VNKKKYRVTLAIEFARRFTVVFTLAIIAITFAGILIGLNDDDLRDVSTLFALGSGLQYSTILQIAAFSLIVAIFSVLLFSEHIQAKINFLFRGFLLLLLTLATTSIFVLAFNWFPSNDMRAWLGFVFCYIGSFLVSFALTLFILKLEGKKYTKLLEDYKVRHNAQ